MTGLIPVIYFVACSWTCKTVELIYAPGEFDFRLPTQCMKSAPVEMAKWSLENPGYKTKHYRCRMVNPDLKKA